MNDDTQDHDEDRRCAALTSRLAGVVTASMAISLLLVPEAFARLAVNHSETVLALD